MTGMNDYIDVKVTFQGREVASGRYKVPFLIGKNGAGTNSITIGENDPWMSRQHATVDLVNGRLQLTDSSTNGTVVRGKSLVHQSVELSDGETFEIRGYVIQVRHAQADPSIPMVVEAHVLYLGKEKLVQEIGEMALMFLRTKQRDLFFEPISLGGENFNFRHVAGRFALQGEYPYGMLYAQNGRCIFEYAQGPESPRVLLNKIPLASVLTVLQPRDTIQVAAVRVELVPPGERSLRCRNSACERLNPYDHRTHCQYCGWRLNEAETVVARRQ